MPLATGERDRTIWEVIAYLQNNAIDILQSDVGHCGGISQLRKIATLAEAPVEGDAPGTIVIGAVVSLGMVEATHSHRVNHG